MQPLLGGWRSDLSEATVTRLIEASTSLQIDSGLELIDRDLNTIADISDNLRDGRITRHGYAILHAKADLNLDLPLDWGTSVVRPFIVLSDGVDSARFNLGAYFTNTPRKSVNNPYAVNGMDILDALYDPVGTSFGMAKDAGFLATIEDILQSRGFPPTSYFIDPRDYFKTTSKARTWVLDENLTWLKICNELCNMIGYRGLWSDWDGRIRVEPYAAPDRRAIEYRYTAEGESSLIGRARSVTTDLYKAPNRWVLYRTNLFDSLGQPIAPVLGAGAHEYTNFGVGPTSVAARNGRVITRLLGVEAADQEALVRRMASVVSGDLERTTKVEVETGIVPLHWHFDKIRVDDPDNISGDMLVTAWSLSLSGLEPMQQAWSVIHPGLVDVGEDEFEEEA